MKDAPVKLLGYQKEYNARKGKGASSYEEEFI
jgi:hypothetical protein